MTDRLVEAFKMVSVKISQREEKQEESLIQASTPSISRMGNRFTPGERLILNLHLHDQMSAAEIAATLDVPESKISQMLNRLESEI